MNFQRVIDVLRILKIALEEFQAICSLNIIMASARVLRCSNDRDDA